MTGGRVAVDVVVLPSLPQHHAPLHVPVSPAPAHSCVGPLGIAVLQRSVVLVGCKGGLEIWKICFYVDLKDKKYF